MTKPTHDEISRLAQELWRQKGSPVGADHETWLEAERQLTGRPPGETFAARAAAETAAESEVEFHLSPAQTEQQSIAAALQKDAARAPQVPHHTGPKSKPAETGKPLWTRPHSS